MTASLATRLPPLTATRALTSWHLDVAAAVVVGALGVSYLLGVRATTRHGGVWSLSRTAGFLGLGLGSIVVATMSSMAVYAHVLLSCAAVQVVVLLTVSPMFLALGRPLELARSAQSAAGAARWQGVVDHPVVRVLTFPVVAPVLGVATQLVVMLTGYLPAAERSGPVLHLMEAQLLVTGCLFALPVLGTELLPAWCTQPVRLVIAGVDGLLDAIPGVVVLTASSAVADGWFARLAPSRGWGPSAGSDQTIAGGLMFTIAEVMAVPVVAIVFRNWVREDSRRGAVVDRTLDETTPPEDVGRPWWEVEPGPVADRFRR